MTTTKEKGICPDCGKITILNLSSGLDQCEDRSGCGYGWFDEDKQIGDFVDCAKCHCDFEITQEIFDAREILVPSATQDCYEVIFTDPYCKA